MPHVGTWIEMSRPAPQYPRLRVVPHVGTWIEIGRRDLLPPDHQVVPHVGTWIEIEEEKENESYIDCRASRRHVD